MPRRTRTLRWRTPELAVLLLLVGGDPSAGLAASLSTPEVQVLAKALALMQLPPGSAATIAIAYAAGNAGSRADAEQIAGEIGDGVRIGNVILKPQVTDVAGLKETQPVAIVAATGANGDDVMRVSRERHALCVTAELAAVESGRCTMTIRSNPRIEIIMNAEAARAAEIGFPVAFHLMVREL
jgi:hypothetical protein